MKKRLFFGIGFCALMLGGAFAASNFNKLSNYVVVKAEETEPTVTVVEPTESTEPEEEKFECSVIVPKSENGQITVSAVEGHIGDVVTIVVEPNLFYKIDTVSVNGVNLIESATTSGEFTFSLVEGENVIAVNIIIDQEMFGEMSVMVEEAMNQDWKNLFSVKNVLIIVKTLLDSGILIAVIRYFVKDKKVAEKMEGVVKEEFEKLIPQATKETVLATIEELIAPVFAEITSKLEEQSEAINIFSKCFALAQEDTPEARIAIVQLLSSIKLSDKDTVSSVKEYIENYINENKQELADIISKMKEIEKYYKDMFDNSNQGEGNKEEEKEDDGTQI